MSWTRNWVLAVLVWACASQGLQAQVDGIVWIVEGPLAADFDRDGRVGFADFMLFVTVFETQSGDPGYNPEFDLTGDGVVNLNDFISFTEAFGTIQEDQLPSRGFEVYVVDLGADFVGVIDFGSNLFQEYLTFRGPSGMTISKDEESIYISEAFGLFVMNAERELQFSVPLESAGRVVLSPDENLAYVAEAFTSQVTIIDVERREPVDTIGVGTAPQQLGLTPDGGKLYVMNALSFDISVLDLIRREEVGRIDVGSQPVDMRITADGQRAYVLNGDRPVISVLDLVSDRVIGAIQLDDTGNGGLAFSPDGKILYISSGGALLSLDVGRNLISNRLNLGGQSSSIGISPDGYRAYVGTFVTQSGGSGITVVDLVEWEVMGRLMGFEFPTQIEFRTVGAGEGVE